VLLSHHFLFLQQLSLAIAAATVFLHSIIRNLAATFNSSPLVQFLSNKSAAEPEKKKKRRGRVQAETNTRGGRAGGHTETESREQRKKNTARGTETEQQKKKEQGA